MSNEENNVQVIARGTLCYLEVDSRRPEDQYCGVMVEKAFFRLPADCSEVLHDAVKKQETVEIFRGVKDTLGVRIVGKKPEGANGLVVRGVVQHVAFNFQDAHYTVNVDNSTALQVTMTSAKTALEARAKDRRVEVRDTGAPLKEVVWVPEIFVLAKGPVIMIDEHSRRVRIQSAPSSSKEITVDCAARRIAAQAYLDKVDVEFISIDNGATTLRRAP